MPTILELISYEKIAEAVSIVPTIYIIFGFIVSILSSIIIIFAIQQRLLEAEVPTIL